MTNANNNPEQIKTSATEDELQALLAATSEGGEVVSEEWTLEDDEEQEQTTRPQEKKQAAAGSSESFTASSFIEPKTAVELLDNVMCNLGVFVARRFMKVNIATSAIAATPNEKTLMEPAVKAVLDHYKISFDHPLQMLAVVMTSVYGSRLLSVYGQREAIRRVYTPENKTEAQPFKGTDEANDEAVMTSGDNGAPFSPSNPAPFGYKKDGTPRLTPTGRKPGAAKNPGKYSSKK